MMMDSWFSPHANDGLAMNHRPQLILTRRATTDENCSRVHRPTVASVATRTASAPPMTSRGARTGLLDCEVRGFRRGQRPVVEVDLVDGAVDEVDRGTVPLGPTDHGVPRRLPGRVERSAGLKDAVLVEGDGVSHVVVHSDKVRPSRRCRGATGDGG